MLADSFRRARRAALGDRWPLTVAALASVAGVAVFVVATTVFPYHSLNHDEGVYLQQAAMLLDGQLFLDPPVDGSFRPWFFIESSQGMYSKYAPVPAAMFAPGLALGLPRLSLAAIGAGIAALVVLVGAELFDRPTGLLAGVVLTASPLFLVDASVFLPYAPTTLLNLGFALAYLRSQRTESVRLAAVAGAAAGLAFFARPYTAVLFATPFIVHALWTLRTMEREVIVRQGVTAAVGLCGVALTLGYNTLTTGSPFVFPYQAFAPNDGLGFGHHEILGHERDYTPALALEVNSRIVARYATEWMAAGLLGTAAAAVGLAVTLARRRSARRLALAGVVLSVVLGEIYFWGTLNTLGAVEDPTDGLITYLGTYYHFDLLVPTAVFAAVGILAAGRWAWGTLSAMLSLRAARAVGAAMLLVSVAAAGSAAIAAADGPINENRAVTDHYEAAYQPFEDREFENSVVFLPEPYGPWLNHPFQALRNDPDFDGETVYALDGQPFAVADAYPERTLYRYAYRNAWTPVIGEPVTPTVQRVDRASGSAVRQTTHLGVPESAILVSIRLQSEDGRARYTVSNPPSNLTLNLTLTDGQARLSGPNVTENVSLDVSASDLVSATVFVDYGAGRAFSYEVDTPVEHEGESVRALTPTLEYCRIPHRCNGRAAYVPSETPEDVFIKTALEAVDR